MIEKNMYDMITICDHWNFYISLLQQETVSLSCQQCIHVGCRIVHIFTSQN